MLLAACGENSSTTSSVPTTPDPNPGGTIPTKGPTNDPRLPSELATSSNFTLSDRTNFTGLNDILRPENSFVVAPIVGDPKIKLTFTTPISSTLVSGKLFFAFEDQAGLWFMRMNTVDDASVKAATTQTINGVQTAVINTDAIYTDNYMTVRVLSYSTDNGATQHGYLYYRMRQAGETQCFKQTITCVDQYGNPLPASYCSNPNGASNMVTTCRNYAMPGDPNVKLLGTF